MRYPPQQKRETRQRILEAAGRRFREKGFVAAGVDEVMRAAGLTAGGFYAHFASKRALLQEVLGRSLEATRTRLLGGLEHLEGPAWIREVARRYLSRLHRDAVGDGCALPALTAEVSRQPAEVRAAFDEFLQEMLGELEAKMPASPDLSARDRTLGLLALFVGGLALARAVDDRTLSDRILLACRRLALAGLEPPPETKP